MALFHIILVAAVFGAVLAENTANQLKEEQVRAKKAALPLPAVSGAAYPYASTAYSGIYPQAKVPGYYPGYSAYPYNAGYYGNNAYSAYPYSTGYSYAGYPQTATYPYGNTAYPYGATGYPYGAAAYPYSTGYPYNKLGYVAPQAAYAYKGYDDGKYYPEKYELPYAY